MSAAADLTAVARLLERHQAIAVACHEGPDGDALGSVRAMGDTLSAAGWDVALWVPGTAPLPRDLSLLGLDDLPRHPPADLDRRLLLALDCGSVDRLGEEGAAAADRAAVVANVDHHADNTRFGDVAAVDPGAACTTILALRLLRLLGLEPSRRTAVAIYVGIVTDTGRFMYANADAEAHRVAAELIEGGVRPDEVFRALYEGRPAARVRLHARSLDALRLLLDGRLAVAEVSVADLEATGAAEDDAEGIVDQLRAIEGVQVAAVIREPRASAGGQRKCSLRSADPAVDVALIARALGGGGHAMAAGFSSDRSADDIATAIARELGGA